MFHGSFSESDMSELIEFQAVCAEKRLTPSEVRYMLYVTLFETRGTKEVSYPDDLPIERALLGSRTTQWRTVRSLTEKGVL